MATSACEDHEGNLIVGTFGEGVYWFLPGNRPVNLLGGGGGLSHNTILSLCYDHEGNLWVGTDGGGLNRVRRQVFGVVPESRGRVVTSVCEGVRAVAHIQGSDTKDALAGAAGAEVELWVGYNGENVERFRGGKVASYSSQQGLRGSVVRSVFQDAQGRTWAGTAGRGLLRFGDGIFQSVQAAGFFRGDQEVSAIFEDRQGRVWIGTQSGLACSSAPGLEEKAAAPGTIAGEVWRMFTTRDGLSGRNIRCLAEDREGGVWVGTEGGGLNRLRLNEGKAQFELYGRTNGIPSDNISALCVDQEGVLWVGTPSGLVRYKAGKWSSLGNVFGHGAGHHWLFVGRRGRVSLDWLQHRTHPR